MYRGDRLSLEIKAQGEENRREIGKDTVHRNSWSNNSKRCAQEIVFCNFKAFNACLKWLLRARIIDSSGLFNEILSKVYSLAMTVR